MRLVAHYDNVDVEYKQETGRIFLSDENLTVPTDGVFARVLHDWELPEFEYKPRQLNPGYEQKKPMPSTRMLWGRDPYTGRIYDFVSFSKEWQFWLMEFLKYPIPGDVPYGKILKVLDESYLDVTPGSLLWAYVNLVENHRSFTDNHAPENNYADYVTGRNLSRPPYQVKCLMMTGNIVKIIGSSGDHYVIEALDLLKPPPPITEVIRKPWLFQWSTEQSVTELPKLNNKRRWVVARYPQIKVVCRANNLPENGTPFIVVSKGGTNIILKKHVQILQGGQKYSPYVPEK